MFGQTHFVIFKGKSRYSITECSNSGIQQAFISRGTVIGDENVIKHSSKIKPKDETIEIFVENNAGYLIYGEYESRFLVRYPNTSACSSSLSATLRS